MQWFTTVTTFLAGKKTYVMIAVDALDQIGVAQGWWEGSRVREIVEAAFTAGFFRAGVTKSGPTQPVS